MACAPSPPVAEKGQDLLTPLLEALTLEPKYQPALALPHTAKVSCRRGDTGGAGWEGEGVKCYFGFAFFSGGGGGVRLSFI